MEREASAAGAAGATAALFAWVCDSAPRARAGARAARTRGSAAGSSWASAWAILGCAAGSQPRSSSGLDDPGRDRMIRGRGRKSLHGMA